jgi:hypothetical protein
MDLHFCARYRKEYNYLKIILKIIFVFFRISESFDKPFWDCSNGGKKKKEERTSWG